MFSNDRRRSTRCAAQCLSSVHAQVSATTYHSDPTCSVSIVGGTHEVLYIADKHDSIQADADYGTVFHGAAVPKDAL
jgi:hypothetical protein